ncbi:hypothetical protein WJX79_007076 [Trebouxia sp. C0005]
MATESPAAAAFKPGINAEAYESLRSQVQLLKTEQKQVLGARRAAKQLENLAYLQHQNEAQQQEEAYMDKISKLQTSLQEANERSGKIRQQYERHISRKEAAEAVAAAEAICDSRSVQCQELEDSLREAQEKTSSTTSELKQAQLSNAELTGSVKILQEELAAAKSANMQLQTVLADKQQSWRGQSLSMRAEHKKQVAEYSQRKLQEMNAVHKHSEHHIWL